MLAALRGSSRLAWRAAGPAALVGLGYGSCWVQAQDETLPQIAVACTASAWARFAQSLRLLEPQLSGTEWALEKLQQAKVYELVVLQRLHEACKPEGLDSAWLQSVFLKAACEVACSEPQGPAAQAIAAERSAVLALAAQIDETATQLGNTAELLPLALALDALSKAEDQLVQAHVSHAAIVATTALAHRLKARAPVGKEEELETISQALASVWKTVQPRAAQRDSKQLLQLLRAVPPVEVHAQKTLEEFLPPQIRHRMTAALGTREAAPASTSSSSKAGETIAWGAILVLSIIAVSADGFGLLGFHCLPTSCRALAQSILQQRAVQVEELLAKYDPPTEGLSDSIMLGPWAAQSNYITDQWR